jgi:septal ring factor EnvC (AmiA/AmiB activator)
MAELPSGSGNLSASADKLICEYCECQLAADGRVLRRSERAKTLIQLDTDLERANAENAGLKTSVANLETALADLQTKYAALEKKAKSLW